MFLILFLSFLSITNCIFAMDQERFIWGDRHRYEAEWVHPGLYCNPLNGNSYEEQVVTTKSAGGAGVDSTIDGICEAHATDSLRPFIENLESADRLEHYIRVASGNMQKSRSYVGKYLSDIVGAITDQEAEYRDKLIQVVDRTVVPARMTWDEYLPKLLEDEGTPEEKRIWQALQERAFRQKGVNFNELLPEERKLLGKVIDIGPDASEIPGRMQELCTTLCDKFKDDSHDDIHAIAAHAHMGIVEAHPFDDTNGRIARRIMNDFLATKNLLPIVFLNGNEYTKAVQGALAGQCDFAEYLKEKSKEVEKLHKRGWLDKPTFCANDKCKDPAMQRCGQCKVTHYCSGSCQQISWPQHKLQCIKQ